MALKSGINDFSNSMAAAMQEAFDEAWPEYMDNQPLPNHNPQMQLIFVAVARGVVKHLAKNDDAFSFTVTTHDGHNHNSTGVGSPTSTNGAHSHTVSLTLKGDEINS